MSKKIIIPDYDRLPEPVSDIPEIRLAEGIERVASLVIETNKKLEAFVIPDPPTEITVNNLPDPLPHPETIRISNLEDIHIPAMPSIPEIDTKPLLDGLEDVREAVEGIKIPALPKLDLHNPKNPVEVHITNKDWGQVSKAVANSVSGKFIGGSGMKTYIDGEAAGKPRGVQIMYNDTGIEKHVSPAQPLPVTVISGGSGGTEYTEGDTDASITGTAAMMEGAGNTLLPVQGTVADGLLVNLGSNNDVTITGSVAVTGTFWQAIQPVSGTVAVSNFPASQVVTATDLDIRNLVFATDKVDVSGSEVALDAATLAALETITVVATNLDIRDLTFAADKVDASGTVLGAGTNNIGDVDVASLPGDVEADIDQIRDQIDLITPDIEEIRVDADAIRVATEIMDDWDESDRAKVNLIVGQAGVAANMGTVGATTQRVIEASSDTGAGTKVSVGSSSTSVVSSSATRRGVILVNDSDETIYVECGATATMNEGIRLNASGGSVSITDFTGAINAICASGSKNLTVQTLS